MKKINEVQERKHSEAIRQIVLKPPAWILRWGPFIFLCVLALVFAVLAFVPVIDFAEGQINIIAVTPADNLYMPSSGRSERICVQSGDSVKPGVPVLIYSKNSEPTKLYRLSAASYGTIHFLKGMEKGRVLDSAAQVFSIVPYERKAIGLVRFSRADYLRLRLNQPTQIDMGEATMTGRVFNGQISFLADEPGADGLFDVEIAFKCDPRSEISIGKKGSAKVMISSRSVLYKLLERNVRRSR